MDAKGECWGVLEVCFMMLLKCLGVLDEHIYPRDSGVHVLKAKVMEGQTVRLGKVCIFVSNRSIPSHVPSPHAPPPTFILGRQSLLGSSRLLPVRLCHEEHLPGNFIFANVKSKQLGCFSWWISRNVIEAASEGFKLIPKNTKNLLFCGR